MLPRLRQLERHFSATLAIVGVHTAKFPAERDPANLRAALQRLDVSHPVVADPDRVLWDQYAVRVWPTLIVLDPLGRVVAKHEGECAFAPLRDLVADLLADGAALDPRNRSPFPGDPLPPGGGTLRFPSGILHDPTGNRLIVADTGHHRVLLCRADGRIVGVIGDGRPGLVDGGPRRARFSRPRGLALDSATDRLYVADEANHAVRVVDLASGVVQTVAGTGERGPVLRSPGFARATPLASPSDVALRNDRLWIALAGSHQIARFDPANGVVDLVAGTGAEALHDGPLAEAAFAQPSGIAVDPLGEALFVLDAEASAVRRIDLAHDRVRRLIGRGLFVFGDEDGTGDAVRLQHPLGLAATVERNRSVVHVADTYNHALKRLDPVGRRVERPAGGAPGHTDGPLAGARFRSPSGIAVDGRRLSVADTDNHAIRRIDLDAGTVGTVDLRE